MNLTKTLRKQNYDLIDGSIRNHNLLQLWLKKPLKNVELYYSNINHAFTSNVKLTSITNAALNIDSKTKNEYKFNIGISLLSNILKSLGLGNFDISNEIKSGKKVTISYDNSITKEVPMGEIDSFFSDADFNHLNNILLKNSNRNNILIISGVLFAKNLVVEIETDFSIKANTLVKLNKVVDGKIDFSKIKENKLKMVSSGNSYFPIAVKADRLDFDHGHFKKSIVISRNLF